MFLEEYSEEHNSTFDVEAFQKFVEKLGDIEEKNKPNPFKPNYPKSIPPYNLPPKNPWDNPPTIIWSTFK